jgi:hypothetical protein
VIAGVYWKGVFAVRTLASRGIVMDRRRLVDLKGNLNLNELGDINMHWSIDLLSREDRSLGFTFPFHLCFLLNIRFRFNRFLAAD